MLVHGVHGWQCNIRQPATAAVHYNCATQVQILSLIRIRSSAACKPLVTVTLHVLCSEVIVLAVETNTLELTVEHLCFQEGPN